MSRQPVQPYPGSMPVPESLLLAPRVALSRSSSLNTNGQPCELPTTEDTIEDALVALSIKGILDSMAANAATTGGARA